MSVISPLAAMIHALLRSRSRRCARSVAASITSTMTITGMSTASCIRDHVASAAKASAIQPQRDPGLTTATTSAASAAVASGSARFSVIICPDCVIHEPATISAAGMSATSGGSERRASSQVGKTTVHTSAAPIALASA